MKILMIGLGSIGQRHLRNIRGLYGEKHEILAYRVRGLSHTFAPNMKIKNGVNLEEEFNIRTFYDLNEALKEKPDVAFITNITSEHVPCAIRCAEAGCALFLEKPLGVEIEEAKKLEYLINEKGLVAFMGFQNRYHPALIMLKRLLSFEEIGKIISADIEMGERLETMHTYEDYSTTYMARQDMGGGVVLNQAIHELDYMLWLFGVPKSVCAIGGKSSSLRIDVEDHCSALFNFRGQDREIPVYLHADFIQSPPVRRCKVIGEHGYIEVDLIQSHLTICKHDADINKINFQNFERNDMFIAELKDFMAAVDKKKKPTIPIREGIMSLKMALAIKQAFKVKAWISI